MTDPCLRATETLAFADVVWPAEFGSALEPCGIRSGQTTYGVFNDQAFCGVGYTPWIAAPQPELLPMRGTVTEVECEGLVFLVSISRDAEEIGVQEWRSQAYDPVE